MKRKSINMGLAVAYGAAAGAAIGAATGHMAEWVAIGVAAGAAIGVTMRNNSRLNCCGDSDDKVNPPTGTH